MRRIYKARGILMAPPVVFLLLCRWAEIENELLTLGLGGLLFTTGLCLRVWAQMHLHYRLKISKILTTTGPYIFSRNPIYIANTLMVVSLSFLSELLWTAPIQLVYCLIVYHFVIQYEEARLTDKYGEDYIAYTKEKPRWLFPRPANNKSDSPPIGQYLLRSILVECPNLLLLLPFLIKEFWHD